MLEVLTLLNGVFAGVSMAVDIRLVAAVDVPLPKAGEVAQITFRAEPWNLSDSLGWRDPNSICKYTGVMVPYMRTWEERVPARFYEIEDTVLPPEPDKIAGYALLINKKQCPGQAAEPMLRVKTIAEAAGGRFTTMYHGFPGVFEQLSSLHPDFRPKWLEQVAGTITNAEPTNAVAREFAEYSFKAAKQAEAPAQ